MARSGYKRGKKRGSSAHTTSLRICRINIRATVQQETLIREAAQRRGENLTDFILRTACDKAALELTDTRQFILPADKWKLFVEALDKPPVVKPQLQKLFSEPTVLESPPS